MSRPISAMRRRAGLLALVVSLGVAGCAGGEPAMQSGQDFTPDQVRRFVIAKGDLPSDFDKVESGTRAEPCDSGWLANQGDVFETANEAVVKQELLALGPERCHRSLYEKTVRDSATDGVGVTGFQVFAIVFPSPDAASKALPLLRRSLSDPLLRESYAEAGTNLGAAEDISSLGLGDESLPGIRRVDGPSGIESSGIANSGMGRNYVHVWRVHNVAVRLAGGDVDVTEADVLQIAKNISARAVK